LYQESFSTTVWNHLKCFNIPKKLEFEEFVDQLQGLSQLDAVKTSEVLATLGHVETKKRASTTSKDGILNCNYTS